MKILPKYFVKGAEVLMILLAIQACVPYLHQPLQPRRARLGPETPQNKQLTSLPAPKEKIVAAVYKFRDQTGQYKPSDNGASWSTAISQGTTAILLRALEESNWFVAIERENIGNLLNERKIIRSSRAQYAGEKEENGPLLPPLLFAGVILEGGIISYESNILTGGLGVRYFGTGISGEYREDMVTVYLRAVSTSSGNILKTVYTTKSILSQEVDVGVFRYVKFKRLLETETGFTFNEPSEMAVTEAIEKAVTALILEGQQDGLWNFANPADTSSAVVKSFREERDNNENMDLFNRMLSRTCRGRFVMAGYGGINRFDGDHPDAVVKPYGGAYLGMMLSPALCAGIGFERLMLNSGVHYESVAHIYKAGIRFLPAPSVKLTPYLQVGGGVIQEAGGYHIAQGKTYGIASWGAGFEWLISDRVGVDLGADHTIIFSDEFDGLKRGDYPDMIWSARAGLNIYLGKRQVKKIPVTQ